MTLQQFLNKFTNNDFLITVDGWCDELPFSEYENEKNMSYWEKYKDLKIDTMSILTTNGQPELIIHLK